MPYKIRVKVNCSQCGKELERNPYEARKATNHFCNNSCSGAWRAIHLRGQNNWRWKGGAVKVNCSVCNKELWRERDKVNPNGVYMCGKQCKALWNTLFRVGKDNPTWRGGGQIYYGPNWNEQKLQVRKRDNNVCQACGVKQANLKRLLHVHHIKPFRDFNYIRDENENYLEANRLENLLCLCGKCHMQAEAGKLVLRPKLL